MKFQMAINLERNDDAISMARLEEAMQAHPGCARPTLAMMRHTALYDGAEGREAAIAAVQGSLGRLENLLFGSPDQVIAKFKRYQALGVDEFIYNGSIGLSHKHQKRSLELFCKQVIPAVA